MNFFSTKNPEHSVSFRDAVMNGLPPDNGLYMPKAIPQIRPEIVKSFSKLTFPEIAFLVAERLLSTSIQRDILQQIINNAMTFDAPLVEIKQNVFSLELYHGPTMAFKDFAARFMAHLMGYFVKDDQRELIILVATSGDTGSAVANGFYRVPGIRVVVLYPSGKVSQIQEKQLTTLKENITALEIDGTFDDCQHLVKSAFLDAEMKKHFHLTSANSINIARLIPQTFYYAFARSRLPENGMPVVFSVPCGNYGNLTAGLLARQMGVPIDRFIAASNSNGIVPNYLATGLYQPQPSISTISNAMDVGNPSNFVRMQTLFDNDVAAMRKVISGYTFTDDATRQMMQEVYQKYGYILDPHGAVGYLGLQNFINDQRAQWQGVFLETAHPAKFLDIVEDTLNISLEIPPQLAAALTKKKVTTPLEGNFDAFKTFMMDKMR